MRPAPDSPRGVTHINVRHTTRYTVIGNHLTQHRELSLTAIGLAAHIQSLPEGARVDIKSLAARFREGETRIAAGLRELEAHGYLSRRRERLPSGRVVTHTVSYNQPQRPAGLAAPAARPTAPEPGPSPGAPRKPEPSRGRATGARTPSRPAPTPQPHRPAHGTGTGPHSRTPNAPSPPPARHDPSRHLTATVLLASLHREDPRLLLSERDVNRLAPAVSRLAGTRCRARGRTGHADLGPAPGAAAPSGGRHVAPAHGVAAAPDTHRPGAQLARTRSRTATAATAPSAHPNRAAAPAVDAGPISRRPPSMNGTILAPGQQTTRSERHDHRPGQRAAGRLPPVPGDAGLRSSRWTTPSPANSRSPRKGSSTT